MQLPLQGALEKRASKTQGAASLALGYGVVALYLSATRR